MPIRTCCPFTLRMVTVMSLPIQIFSCSFRVRTSISHFFVPMRIGLTNAEADERDDLKNGPCQNQRA